MAHLPQMTGPMKHLVVDSIEFRYETDGDVVEVRSWWTCDDGSREVRWRRIAPPPLQVLRENLRDRLFDSNKKLIPTPVPDINPPIRGLVHLGMWLAIDKNAVAMEPVRAETGGVWVEASATPRLSRYTFTHPDYEPIVIECVGLGDPIPRSAMKSKAPSPTCGYMPEHRSKGIPFTLTIDLVWAISWEQSDGQTGVWPDVTTSTTIDYEITEIQTIGTG